MWVMVALLFLFFLCLGMRWSIPSPQKPTWPVFWDERKTDCRIDMDCPLSHQICYHSRCWKTEQGNACDAHTGLWVKTSDDTLRCVCKHPHIRQRMDGADCHVDQVCGVHGHLLTFSDPTLCACEDQYYQAGPGEPCLKQVEKDYPEELCRGDYYDSEGSGAAQVFHPDYLAQFSKRKCLAPPCSFNVMNGKLLRHTTYERDHHGEFRCVCDPAYGHFGVHLPGYTRAKDGQHNACASLYEDEPDAPNYDVSLFTYFYMATRPAITFLVFRHVSDGLAKPFEGRKTIVLSEEWPHGLDQMVLYGGQLRGSVRHLRRECKSYFRYVFSQAVRCYENGLWERLPLPNCSDVTTKHYIFEKVEMANEVYRDRFVCFYDSKPDTPFTNQYVVNPYALEALSLREKDRFSHGYEITRLDENTWRLEPAPTVERAIPLEKASERLLGQSYPYHRTNILIKGTGNII